MKNICGIIFVVFVLLVLTGTAMGEVSRTGLVAEWHFDGNVNDSSGNGIDGTTQGAPSFVDGKLGKALAFSGNGDNVDFGTGGGKLDFGTGDFSLEFWMNYQGTTVHNITYIMGKTSGGTNSNGFFSATTLLRSPNGNYVLDIDTTTSPIWYSGDAYYGGKYTDGAFYTNNWYHAVFVRSGNTWTIYINGDYSNSTTNPYIGLSVTNATVSFNIGKSIDSDWTNFKGMIEEVRIYNRALTADEVKNNYEAGRIIITSSPPGAEVLVNGESKGIASPTLSVYGVSPGTYTIKCRLSGYSDYDANVVLTATSVASVSCLLPPNQTPTPTPTPTPTLTLTSTLTPTATPTQTTVPPTAVPPTASPASNTFKVTLTSDPASVEPGQTSTIILTVTGSDGIGISGADVALDSTPSGKLDPASGTTNPFGRFTSTFTAPTKENATIEALVKKEGFAEGKGILQLAILSTPVSDKESDINPILIVFALIITAALIVLYLWTKGTLQLILTQTSILCDGESTIPIKVQFVNAFGKVTKQRKDRVVEMDTTSGKMQNIVIPAGKESVEAILTSSKEYGPVTITAKSGKQKATAQVDFECDETGLDVKISPASIPADGKSTAMVSIRIKDDKGNYITSLQERTVDVSTTIGMITSYVKIPPRNPAGTAVIKAGKMSGTAKVMATSSPFNKKGKMLIGEGRIIFTELAKRYCMHCGAPMTMDEQSCPSCGKIPPSGIDTRLCNACKAVLPISAKFCNKCGAGQPDRLSP